jgi:hypothetical protein
LADIAMDCRVDPKGDTEPHHSRKIQLKENSVPLHGAPLTLH